ncbi:DUF6279 family lipoprotein [Aquipseudomonas ullengensis]|uniref:Lipoprotein n=1 Tax=Aquipseudomonas ullengensis TaxID=2759166 RepID=A0A7W4LKH9_9GAMM|nr:DUF6279 family lipoprotein [Pseudomonas ullengensis]MBB2494801.1 hypothetical protein [Pseudomonas ullengensis]
MRLHRLTLALLCTTLLLGACSRLDIGYRNLDWLISWSLDDYLDLSRQQKQWLKPRLHNHLRWHCSTQLPLYSDWLQRSEQLIGARPLDPAQLDAQFDQLRQAIDTIAVQTTPTVTELLRGLSPAQVAHLRKRLAQEDRELRQEYLEPSPAQQVSERQERMVERFEPWLGSLSTAQKNLIARWAQKPEQQSRLWFDNRARWQDAFLATLEQRSSEDFNQQLRHLLQQRTDFWTPAHREQFARSQTALAQLFAELINSADSRQQQHLLQRLHELRQDLDGLACVSPATPAVASRSE